MNGTNKLYNKPGKNSEGIIPHGLLLQFLEGVISWISHSKVAISLIVFMETLWNPLWNVGGEGNSHSMA